MIGGNKPHRDKLTLDLAYEDGRDVDCDTVCAVFDVYRDGTYVLDRIWLMNDIEYVRCEQHVLERARKYVDAYMRKVTEPSREELEAARG